MPVGSWHGFGYLGVLRKRREQFNMRVQEAGLLNKYFFIGITMLLLGACGGNNIDDLMAEGSQYLRNGNYQGAIVIYKTVLEKSPEKMEARYGLGKSYLRTGKLDQALKNLEKYQRQNPYDKEVFFELGELRAAQRDFSAAVELLREYCNEFPDSAKGFEYLGVSYAGLGNMDLAQANLEQAIELDSDMSSAYVALIKVYSDMRDTTQADAMLSALLEKWPNHREGLYYKASREAAKGDIESYRKVSEQLAKAHPSDGLARYIVGKNLVEMDRIDEARELAGVLKSEFPDKAYGNKLLGLIYYIERNYKDAILEYQKALSVRPDVEAQFFIGMALYGKGDLETSISYLRNAADRSPKFIKAREMISVILLQQRRYDEAISEAKKVLSVDPENVVARMTLGDSYKAKGDNSSALAEFSSVTDLKPQAANAYIKMGSLYYSLGELEKTEGALREAMTAAPENYRPRIVLASFYLQKGERKIAERTLEEGLLGEPGDAVIYNLLARIALANKEVDRANELLAKAKEINPASPHPYLMTAAIRLAQNKPEEAVTEYDSLLEKRPDYLRALFAKAAIFEIIGKNEEAVASYEKGLLLGEADAFSGYAIYLQKHGKQEEALALVERGLESHAGHPGLDSLRIELLLRMERFQNVLTKCQDIERHDPGKALRLQTRTYMLMREYEKALISARQMVEFYSDKPFGYLTLYEIYNRLDETENAIQAMELGLAKCDSPPQLLVVLGQHFANSDTEKALNYLDAAIKRDEKYYPAYSAQGAIYHAQGRVDEAIERYTKTLELTDRYVPALNNLAMLYAENENTATEALRLAYNAYLNSPANAAVMDTFGYALTVNGKLEEAVKVLNKALELDDKSSSVNYHLGIAYHKMGKDDLAVASLNRAIEGEDKLSVSDARKLLAEINGG